MAEVMRFAASNVQEGVVPDSGHWVMWLKKPSSWWGKRPRAFLHLLRAASAA
jgi:hypothetical protein